MLQYKVDIVTYLEWRKQSLKRGQYIKIILVVAAVLIGIIISHKNGPGSMQTTILALLIAGFVIWRGLRNGNKIQDKMMVQVLELMESYTLKIEGNLIIREQINTPTISIYLNEITTISKLKNGALWIKGSGKDALIIVPPQLQNIATLEAYLNEVKPISGFKGSFLQKNPKIISVALIAAMLTVRFASNKIVVGICGMIAVSFLSWSYYEIMRNKNIASNIKRYVHWLLLIIAIITVLTIMKLTGYYVK